MTRRPTPLAAILRGLVAGVAGTGAMTAAQTLPAKLGSSNDGEAEQSGGGQAEQDPWEQASTPAKVARRVSEGVFDRDIPPERINAITQAMHWGYGTAWGAVYGILEGSRRGPATLRGGLAFGTGVWAMSYVQLVPMGLYQPPWRYPPKELAMDLGYHLAYGAGLAGAYRALGRLT